MKQIFSIVLLCIGFCLPSFGQKTAQEYFNVSSKLYAEKQEEAALYTVSRGCELFESDSALAQLKRLIEKDDKKNQQNQQNSNDQGNDDKQEKNQSGQDQKQDQQQNGQDNKQQNQQQEQQSAENQGKDENKEQQNQPKDKKGQISEIQAEMLLDAIDNDDKAIQQRLKQQRQNKQNQNRIEKNW